MGYNIFKDEWLSGLSLLCSLHNENSIDHGLFYGADGRNMNTKFSLETYREE